MEKRNSPCAKYEDSSLSRGDNASRKVNTSFSLSCEDIGQALCEIKVSQAFQKGDNPDDSGL